MKKILITGANSYIGTSFEKYINENYSTKYQVETIDMKDPSWREKSFEGYDVVFHVSGIAHIKETKQNANLYFEVNRDLAVEVAIKAKNDGIKQFIFLSTMSVYGKDTGVITKETKPNPKTNYGKSKLQAEEQIIKLRCDSFKVCILRPPMVYGEGCKGNYQTLIKIVKKSPLFPRVNNKRSLVHINTLVTFVEDLICNEMDGLFFPQEKDYIRTIDLVNDIAKGLNKKVYFSFVLGFVILIFKPFIGKLRKAFGSLIYKL